jgi:uncharacterized protein (TIGR03083 family)
MTSTGTPLDQNAYSDKVAAEITRLADAIRNTEADTPVPSCPGWTANVLADHIGMIHRWVNQTVQESATVPLDFPQFGQDLPKEWSGYGDWLEAMSGRLSETLRQADPTAPTWSFTNNQTASFWFSRMLQETAMHRVDAELAAGRRPEVETDTALDGVDELLFISTYAHPFRSGPADLTGQGESVHLHATDADVHWLIKLTPEGHTWARTDADEAGQASATVRGPAGDLYLYQYNRLSDKIAAVERSGDIAVLDDWLTRSAL